MSETSIDVKERVFLKVTSSRFWLAVAAALGSISMSIAGLAVSNDTVAVAGIVCGVASAAIYQACRTATGVAQSKAETQQTIVTQTVTATSTDKATVDKAINGTEAKEAQ